MKTAVLNSYPIVLLNFERDFVHALKDAIATKHPNFGTLVKQCNRVVNLMPNFVYHNYTHCLKYVRFVLVVLFYSICIVSLVVYSLLEMLPL